jgi:hypothetical protein
VSWTVGSIRSWSVHDVCRQRQKACRRTYPGSRVSSLEIRHRRVTAHPAAQKRCRQEVNGRRLDLRQDFTCERVELRNVSPKSKTAPIVQKRKPVIKLPKVGSLIWDLELPHRNCSFPFRCKGSCEIMLQMSDVLILVFEILCFASLVYCAKFTFLLTESIVDTNF